MEKFVKVELFNYAGRRPVMAAFYYTFISCNRNIVSRDSTSLIKQTRGNCRYITDFFLEQTIICACDRS